MFTDGIIIVRSCDFEENNNLFQPKIYGYKIWAAERFKGVYSVQTTSKVAHDVIVARISEFHKTV